MERTELEETAEWLKELRFIETEIAHAISDIRSYVTEGMNTRLDRARQVTGLRYDVMAGKYLPND